MGGVAGVALGVLIVITGCGDNLPPAPCTLVGSPGPGPRMEAISYDGTLVAFSVDGAGERDLYVAPAACEAEAARVASDISFARFCGSALLAFRGTEEAASAVLGWVPGGPAAAVLALDVDPGATHCADDGLHFSMEANDLIGGPDLVVGRTTDLVLRTVAHIPQARARFTHDSAWLVYGGNTRNGLDDVWRQPVDGGTPLLVTAANNPWRWEITRDDRWLIHTAGDALVRTALDGGAESLLATGVSHTSGKEFDVAADGVIAYVSNEQLRSVAVDGSAGQLLLATGVGAIVEHYPGLVLYTRSFAGGPSLLATATAEPSPWRFGGDSQEPTAAMIADKAGDAVVIGNLDSSWIPLPPQAATVVSPGWSSQVALSHDGRVLVRHVDEAPLELVDPHSLGTTHLLDSTLGDFVLEPDRRWLAVPADTPDGPAILKLLLP